MTDFECVDLVNYIHENKNSNSEKALIMNKAVNEIIQLQRKTKKTENADDDILLDILFVNYNENNLMKSILLWLFFWLDKNVFVEDINKLIYEKGSVLKSIRTIRNKEDNTFIHGLKN